LSLKRFHILFITVSVLMAVGFAAWAGYQHFAADDSRYLALGIVSLIIGVVLIVYGRAFRRKINELEPQR